MAEITAKAVKSLRDRTGAGMMDCKKALLEAGGDEEQAIDLLRQWGAAKAAKRAERETSEGLVQVVTRDGVTAMVSVSSETDFVARNDEFQDFADRLATAVIEADLPDGATLTGEEPSLVAFLSSTFFFSFSLSLSSLSFIFLLHFLHS